MMNVASILILSATLAHAGALKSRDHTTERGGVKLALIEKWKPGNESKWKANGKVILLVHGATWSSKCTFDAVPGYSMMDALAEDGWDVWALDLHGYGASGKNEDDWTEATHAAGDLDTAADFIRAYRWVEKIHVFGYQWGAQAAALFAEQKPNKVSRLALFGMRWQLYDKGSSPASPSRNNSAQQAMLKPDDGDLDQPMVKKRAEVCALHDVTSPNGALRDLGKPSPSQPKRLDVPTLLIQGERDGEDDVLNDRIAYFKAIPIRHKSFVIVPGVGKHAPIERSRARFVRALLDFLDAN
jgi:pimeloyl-ACP methyl ester carboxylesterase